MRSESVADKAGEFSRSAHKTLTLAAAGLFAVAALHSGAQRNEWTWVGGSEMHDQDINYGALGATGASNYPGSREQAITWTDREGNFWLLGGWALGEYPESSEGTYGDLWEFRPSAGEWIWIAGPDQPFRPGIYGKRGVADASNWPGARAGSAVWTDSKGNVWIFGGGGIDAQGHSGYLDDLWKFDPSTRMWTWMGGEAVLPTCPSTNSCGPNGVYGKRGVGSASNHPGGRADALHWTDASGNFWLFGGYIYVVHLNGWEGYENDLWRFDPETNEWTWMGGDNSLPVCKKLLDSCGRPGVYGQRLEPSATNLPGSRRDSFTWTDADGDFWLFGGFGYDAAGIRGELNDLWEFRPSTKEWTWVTGDDKVGQTYGGSSGTFGIWQQAGTANTPSGRDSGEGWSDPDGNLWLFGGGGYDASGNYGLLVDLWKFDPKTREWAWMSGNGSVDQLGSYGILDKPSVLDAPGSRLVPAVWKDASGDLWLFGGNGFDSGKGDDGQIDRARGTLGDLWKFQPKAGSLPVTRQPSISPPGDTYASVQTVSLSDSTPGAAIYYRIGVGPLKKYTHPIAVPASETIQAIATAAGYENSRVSVAIYRLTTPPSKSAAPRTTSTHDIY